MDQVDRIANSLRTGIRPEIPGLILLHLSGKHDPRKCLAGRHFNKRICLVIHEHRIVLRMMFFYKIALENQRLQLRIRHNVFEPADVRHHLFDLDALVPAGLKILAHPVLQADSLAHINDVVILIVHDIDARPSGQFFQFFLNIKHD